MTLKIGSFCSGFGGLDLAVMSVLDAEVAWHAEIDPDASRVLDYHWPGVPNHGDLTTANWADASPIDILTCGFPCQPVSAAGQRKGTGDDRWLWNDIVAAIGRMGARPRMLLFENVPGLLTANGGDAMARVVHGLASLGYVGRYRLLRASDVGAPHRRERWFCLARLASDTSGDGYRHAGQAVQSRVSATAVGGVVADAGGTVGGRSGDALPGDCFPPGAQGRAPEPGRCGGLVADSAGDRWDEGRPEPAGFVGGLDAAVSGNGVAADPGGAGLEDGYLEQHGPECEAVERGGLSASPDTDGCASRPERDGAAPGDAEGVNEHLRDDADGLGLDFGAYDTAIRRWERLLGRAAPAPTEPGRNGQPRLNPRFVEWMVGLSDGWVTAVPGLSRNAMLRLLGNGVVPQQGAAAFDLLTAALGGEVAAA